MKIYPSTHKIKSVTDSHVDLDLNIPLAYIELDYSKYKIDKKIKNIANKEIKQEVLYNQCFDSADVKLFNKFNEEVNIDNLLTRVGDKYYYRPKESIIYKPQTFNYEAVIKKSLDYKIANEYHINIACVDDPDSLDLSDRLSIGFSNPSDRSLVPPNIVINNNRMDSQAFTDMSIDECDFLFIESYEGIYYDDVMDDKTEIDKNMFLNNNTSIWITAEYNRRYPHNNTDTVEQYVFKKPLLNKSLTVKSQHYFDFDSIPYNPAVKYHNLFLGNRIPIVLIEHIGKGFEIVSHENILKDIKNNLQLIYETIMYCFLNGYKKTPIMNQWISNEVPDYQIEYGKLVKKKYLTSDINLYSYFGLQSSEMDLYSVNIYGDYDNQNNPSAITSDKDFNYSDNEYDYTTEINFIGMTNGKLMFSKNASIASPYNIEPEKPMGWVSVFNGDYIIYLKEIHYTIETDLNDKIFTSVNEDDLEVKVLAFKSSSLGLNTQKPFSAVIPFIKTEVNKIERIREADYLFYINKENQDMNFVFSEDFKDELGIPLFEIRVYQTSDAVNVTDMRQLGGGLKEDRADNYNLLDIGHINGRPYRKTGTIVFTLPKELEQYDSLIEKAINKYIGASEVPIIFYEDKE